MVAIQLERKIFIALLAMLAIAQPARAVDQPVSPDTPRYIKDSIDIYENPWGATRELLSSRDVQIFVLEKVSYWYKLKLVYPNPKEPRIVWAPLYNVAQQLSGTLPPTQQVPSVYVAAPIARYYQKPKTTSMVQGELRLNARIQILEEKDGWLRIQHWAPSRENSFTGWLPKQDVRETPFKLETLMQDAQQAVAHGDDKIATYFFERVVALDRTNFEAVAKLIDLYQKSGEQNKIQELQAILDGTAPIFVLNRGGVNLRIQYDKQGTLSLAALTEETDQITDESVPVESELITPYVDSIRAARWNTTDRPTGKYWVLPEDVTGISIDLRDRQQKRTTKMIRAHVTCCPMVLVSAPIINANQRLLTTRSLPGKNTSYSSLPNVLTPDREKIIYVSAFDNDDGTMFAVGYEIPQANNAKPSPVWKLINARDGKALITFEQGTSESNTFTARNFEGNIIRYPNTGRFDASSSAQSPPAFPAINSFSWVRVDDGHRKTYIGYKPIWLRRESYTQGFAYEYLVFDNKGNVAFQEVIQDPQAFIEPTPVLPEDEMETEPDGDEEEEQEE